MEPQKQETLGQAFGRLGGLATSKAHGKPHYRRMALLSAIKRQKNKKRKGPDFDFSFAQTNKVTTNKAYTNESKWNDVTTS